MSTAGNQQPDKESWGEWGSRHYNEQYDKWMPWIEDQYLRWFTKDNKASYATKQQMDKSKVTGIEQVDTLQDGVNSAVSQQVGKGGILQPIGDMASKEGVNRAERKGKDDKGSYGVPGTEGVVNQVQNAGSGVYQGAQTAGSKLTEGVKGAGSLLGGGSEGNTQQEKTDSNAAKQ